MFFSGVEMEEGERKERERKEAENPFQTNSLYLCLDEGRRGVDAQGQAPAGAPGGDLLCFRFWGGRSRWRRLRLRNGGNGGVGGGKASQNIIECHASALFAPLLTSASASRCARASPPKSAARTASHSGQEAQGTSRGSDIDSSSFFFLADERGVRWREKKGWLLLLFQTLFLRRPPRSRASPSSPRSSAFW